MKPRFGRFFRRKKRLPDGSRVELPIYWIAYYHNGVEVRESSHSTKYHEAERLLKQKHAEILRGEYALSARRVTVGELLDGLLRDYEINGKSVEWARFVVGHLRPFFGRLKADQVTSDQIEWYIQGRRRQGILNSTVNRELSLLRRAYHLGWDATPRKVARIPKVPKLAEPAPRAGFFEEWEFLAIRRELPEHLRPVLAFAYYTGCRRGEILSLSWEQVDLAERIVRLEPGTTKNDEARTIPLTTELVEMLSIERARRDQQWPSSPWVFARFGKRIRSMQDAWEAACRRAGLWSSDAETGRPTRRFHDLRRTGVRNLIRAGVPERVAMTISGHKTRSVFDRYNVVSERDLHDAARRLENYTNRDATRTLSRTPDEEAAAQREEAGAKFLN